MPRDSQRSKLYHAEASAPKGQHFASVGDIQNHVDRITTSLWWRNRSATVKVYVKDGRGRRKAGAWTNRALGFLTMPRWSRYELCILHELAHVMTPRKYADHGREFVRSFLALVDRWMGKQAAADLRESFRQHRVKWYRKP